MQLESVAEFSVSVGNEGASPKGLGDFASREVERTRRFAYPTGTIPGVGRIEDMRLFVTYDAAGNASCRIDYVEVVEKLHIVSGSTRIGLLDVNSKIIIDWEHPLFRECGRHARSFSGAITRDIAEAVTGLHFRTVGNAQGRRC
jgi:hypothetical protein